MKVFKQITSDNYEIIADFLGVKAVATALNVGGWIEFQDLENVREVFVFAQHPPEMYCTVTDAYLANRAYR